MPLVAARVRAVAGALLLSACGFGDDPSPSPTAAPATPAPHAASERAAPPTPPERSFAADAERTCCDSGACADARGPVPPLVVTVLRDEDDAPLAGARVVLLSGGFGVPPDRFGAALGDATAGADGVARFEHPGSDVGHANVSAPGRETRSVPCWTGPHGDGVTAVQWDGTAREVAVRLRLAGRIEGRVLGPDGAGVAAVPVQAWEPESRSGDDLRTVTTSADGAFAFEGVAIRTAPTVSVPPLRADGRPADSRDAIAFLAEPAETVVSVTADAPVARAEFR